MAEDEKRGLTPFPKTPPMVRDAAVAVAITLGAMGCGEADTPMVPPVDSGSSSSDAGAADADIMGPMPQPFDAGDALDAGFDAGSDEDAGVMTPMVDASFDGGEDAGVIAPMPPPLDAGVDSGVIAPMPAPFDGGVIARPDSGVIAPMPPPPMPPPMPDP